MNKQALEKWAKEALEFYNKTAPVIDLPFNLFQKPADFDHECDLLLIGLNPGNKKEWESWACQFKNLNSNWYNQPIDGKIWFDDNGMNEWGFLAGNPAWYNSSNWRIVQSLSTLNLSKKNLDKVGNWQYINYVPFGTHDFRSFLNKSKAVQDVDVLGKCVDLTADYIKALVPKKIIMLATTNGIDLFRDRYTENYKVADPNRYAVSATLCGVPTLAFQHPSHLSPAAKEVIKPLISSFLENE